MAEVIYLSGMMLAILPPEDCNTLLAILRARKKETATIVFDPNICPYIWADKDQMRATFTQAAALSDIGCPALMMKSPRLGIPCRLRLHNNTVDWVLVMFWSKRTRRRHPTFKPELRPRFQLLQSKM